MPYSNSQKLMEKVLSDPRYKGKHVIVVAGQVFTANTGDGAAKLLEKLDEQYPQETPEITYIPDANSLIFWIATRCRRYWGGNFSWRLWRLTFRQTILLIFLTGRSAKQFEFSKCNPVVSARGGLLPGS